MTNQSSELVMENESARIVKISNGTEKFEVIEEVESKIFDCLDDAKRWFNLVAK